MTTTTSDEAALDRLDARNQVAGAWCGIACAVLLLIGWCALAQFLPPPSPNLGPEALDSYLSDGTTLKMLGFVIAIWGGVLFLPFSISIALQLSKIGKHVRFWTYTEAAAGIFGTIFVTVPFVAMMAVAFRLDRPVEATQVMSDFAFIFALTTVQGFFVQNFAIGFAILQDRSPTPVFPRWVAYYNFWVALAFVPAALIPFFKTGPFAWNGIFSFWIPVGLFVSWIFVMAHQSKNAAIAGRGRAPSPGRTA